MKILEGALHVSIWPAHGDARGFIGVGARVTYSREGVVVDWPSANELLRVQWPRVMRGYASQRTCHFA